MRPAVATVVSAAGWERNLVAAARLGGLVRVVKRCVEPADVDRAAGTADTVVVGSETPWLTAAAVRRWKALGMTVVGMAADTDRPGRNLLVAGGCDIALSHQVPPIQVLTAILSIRPEPGGGGAGAVATVVGPRGSPGVSEVALGLAWVLAARRRVVLIETDAAAPSLGLRLGLEPATDPSDPALGTLRYRAVGPLRVVILPPEQGPLGRAVTSRIVEAARMEFDVVIVDAGTTTSTGFDPGSMVLVGDSSPAGTLRLAMMVARWDGPPPALVVNRTDSADQPRLRAVRAATGLEPDALVPTVGSLVWGRPPPAQFLSPLEPLVTRLFDPGQRLAAR